MNMQNHFSRPAIAAPHACLAAPASRRPYSLSRHAEERLQERSGMSPDEVLALLEAGAFVRVAGGLSLKHLAERRPEIVGMSFAELRESVPDLADYKVSHLMLWSRAKQRPVTVIVSVKRRTVITALYSETQPGGHDWSDRITPERIAEARRRCEQFHLPPGRRGNAHASAGWLTRDGQPRCKQVRGASIPRSSLPLEGEVLGELVEKALTACGDGHDLKLRLIGKESRVLVEYAITRLPGGGVTVELVELSPLLGGGSLQ